MRRSSWFYLVAVAMLVCGSAARAVDYGAPADVKQIKRVVKSQLGTPGNVAVSHDWALALASDCDSDLSVLLHRVGGVWKVVAHDGGAWGQGDLKAKGVPAAAIPGLLKSYQ